jgi:hypothetical protein
MLGNYLWKCIVYVVPPIDVIAIRRIPHPRKKRKLEMIMRVDESWEDHEPVEVYVCGPGSVVGKSRREVGDARYSIARDLNRRMRSGPRPYGIPRSANYELTFRDQMTILDHLRGHPSMRESSSPG